VPPPVLAVLPVELGELVEQAEATSVAEKKAVEKARVSFMEAPCDL
jgi:hypothetical protein